MEFPRRYIGQVEWGQYGGEWVIYILYRNVHGAFQRSPRWWGWGRLQRH